MYKLRLKYENPVIDLCNIYRGVKLETTTPLGFIPWKYDNGTILNRKTYDTSKPHHIQERTDDNNPARSIIKAPEESVETCGEIDDG